MGEMRLYNYEHQNTTELIRAIQYMYSHAFIHLNNYEHQDTTELIRAI